MANSGPPKKRHKGWSPESSAPTEVTPRPAPNSTTNGTKSGRHSYLHLHTNHCAHCVVNKSVLLNKGACRI